MSITLKAPSHEPELKPKITVFGVGGAGCNAVNNMIRSNLEGVEFVVTNTDAQAIANNLCTRRIQLGEKLTQGLGAGSRPETGKAAAEEAAEEIIDHLEGSNMVFITAGMGGGTGTGAAPVIAKLAKERNVLTVGVVTKPFHFEGKHRMRIADGGIEELTQFVDTLIIIPNQNLFRIANEKTTFADAFNMADDVLYSGVRGVTDLMIMPGLINLDFADIKTVMSQMGKAMMGTGEASGERRAIVATEAAISNPLLEDVSMKGARALLINITGGLDMTLFEVDEAANRIREEVDPDANIIFGSTFDQSMDGIMRVSVVATGIDAEAHIQKKMEKKAISMFQERAKLTELESLQVDLEQTSLKSHERVALGTIDKNALDNDNNVKKLKTHDFFMNNVDETKSTQPSSKQDHGFVPAQAVNPKDLDDNAYDTHHQYQMPQEKPKEKKKLSLFERLTGIRSRAQNKEEEEDVYVRHEQSFPENALNPNASATNNGALNIGSSNAIPLNTGLSHPATQVTPNVTPVNQVSQNENQPSVKPVAKDDELLDIPAFLRRKSH